MDTSSNIKTILILDRAINSKGKLSKPVRDELIVLREEFKNSPKKKRRSILKKLAGLIGLGALFEDD